MDNIKESDPKTKLRFETLGYFKDNKSSVYRKIFKHSILYRDCFEKM